MRQIPILRFLALTAMIAVAGCAAAGQADLEPFATLVIENDATMPVNIYALQDGGGRVRLGQVSALRTSELPLRRHAISPSGQLRVLIDPVGSPRSYTSDTIVVVEGDIVELTVSSFVR